MMTAEELYSCPVCDSDPWHCTCLRKERVRRIAYVIGYPASPRPADSESELMELVAVRVRKD